MDQQQSWPEEGYSQESLKNPFLFSPPSHFPHLCYSQLRSFWADASQDAEEMVHQKQDIAPIRILNQQSHSDSVIKTNLEEDPLTPVNQTANRFPRQMQRLIHYHPLPQQQNERAGHPSEQNYSLRESVSISSEEDQEDEDQEESQSRHIDYRRPKNGERFLNKDIKSILNKEYRWKKQMKWNSTWSTFQNFCFFYSKVYSKNRYTQKQTIQTLVTFLTFGQEKNQPQSEEETKVVGQFCAHLEEEACRISNMISKQSLPYLIWQKLYERRWNDIQQSQWPIIEEELVKALMKQNKEETRKPYQKRAREWCIKIQQRFWTDFSEDQFSILSQQFRKWMLQRKKELKKIAIKRQRNAKKDNLKCYSQYVNIFIDNLQKNRSIRYNQS